MDLLRSGPLTTGEISRQLSSLSRFAVMQHLQVLEDANVVIARKDGRQRLNYCNPVPIVETLGRWMDGHAHSAAGAALHLRRYTETKAKETQELMSEKSLRVEKIELELSIAAPRDVVFKALTEDIGNWWPYRMKPDSDIVWDGDRVVEKYKSGGFCVYGRILVFDPPHQLVSCGPNMMSPSFMTNNVETLTEVDGGTLYQKSLTLWGDVPEQSIVMLRDGCRVIADTALRAYCEQGKRYEIPGGTQ